MLQARLSYDLLFKRGISPKSGKNLNFFSDIVNMKSTEEGFLNLDPTEFSFIPTGEGDVFNIRDRSFLFSSTSISEINNDGSLSLLVSGIVEGERWTVADFQLFAIFSNGFANLVLDTDGVFSYTDDVPKARCLFNFNGQLIMAGHTLDINNFIPSCVPSLADAKSFISWSSIGSLSITPSEDEITAGFQSLNEIGELVGGGKLGNKILVLGTDGCIALTPVEHYFGKETVNDIGPRDAISYCSEDKNLFFIDRLGRLWHVGPDFSFNNLGFSELFKDVEVKMFYFRKGRELFLTTPTKTYVLGATGMYSIEGRVVGVIGKGTVSRFASTQVPTFVDSRFTTSVLDFKDPGLKLLEEISVGIETSNLDAELYFRVYTREKINGPWFVSPYYRLNNDNVVKPHVAGNEFKLEFKGLNFTSLNFSWMTVQYVKMDKRYNRGRTFVDANQEG